jgi:hypothetical protein
MISWLEADVCKLKMVSQIQQVALADVLLGFQFYVRWNKTRVYVIHTNVPQQKHGLLCSDMSLPF